MKKSIFLFFAAILCAMTANAKNVTKPRIYYDNSNTSYGSVAFVVGHNTYSRCYKLTQISNTNLWYRYLNGTGNDSWTDATQIAVFGVDWDSSEGSSIANRRNYTGSKYTNTLTLTSDLNSGKVYLVTAAGNKSNTSIALQSGGYTDLNYTQTVQQQLTTDGTTYNLSTEAIATVSVTSYKLSDYATTASNSGTIASGTSSATCSAARTATVTYTVSGVDAAYSFVGWYDGDTQKSTASTYTATSTEAKTITARFAIATEEEHEVTVTYMCGSTKVTADATAYVGIETEKTFTAPTVTGYNFASWTKGAGIVEKSSNENTITIVTKTGETDYTLVANYEVVNETIYFINAGKWADVYIHLWNGTATGTSWPGTQLTATGTKIGEYDVYEYTAQQGAHVNLLFHKKDNDSQKTADLTWTAGKYYIHNHNGKTGWYTQAEAEEILVVPVVEETVYFVNNKNWTKVQVHAWKDAVNNGWPGQALTATGEKVAGFDVYSFTAPQGTYTNLLFNNKEGDAGVQSNNFVWTDGKYYYMGAAADYAGGTKEDVTTAVTPDPLATDVYLVGEMNSWSTTANEFKKATAEATTASITVNLTAQTYKFKLIIGEGNWRGNTGTMKRGGNAVHEGGWSFEEEGGDDKNCQIVADIAGDYTFTWNLTDKKLTVAYPPLPKHQVTATVNPAETGTVTGIGEYEQGSEATLVATPAAGYAFKNWTVGGTEKSTEATYTFTVNEPISLVANFIPEETHEVTVSYLCNSNPIPGHDAHTLAVGITTPSTITAPAITNYTFNGWTPGSGVQAVDANANPIQITTKAEGEYTLTANYTKIELTYTVKVPEGTEKCYIAGDMNSWSFQEMTPTANANEFTITIDGATTAHKYKYTCGEGWAYVEKKEDGSDLDADRTYNANDVVAKWAEPAKCYLMGNGDWVNGVEMEEDGDQFKLLCHHISAPFKFKYGETWSDAVENYDFPGIAWVDGNIVLPEGDYDFYYKKNENKVWIGVCTPATPTPDYTRATTAGKFGTICLPFGSTKYTGAEFFECVGKEEGKVYLGSVTTLVAGTPYIFLATGTELAVYSDGTTAATPGDHNGLHGTFDDNTVVEVGNYILKDNALCQAATTCYVNANRAYLVMTEVPTEPVQQMPGRRYIGMGVQGENEATGFENITSPEGQVIKAIINGQLIIIRNGEKFNAQGQKL